MISALYLAAQFVMQHPQLASNAAAQISAPGAVDQRLLQGPVADVAREILTCYHKTARMQSIEDTGVTFRDAPQYGADGSDVLVIRYTGVTGMPYAMMVALMTRGDGDAAEVRAKVLRDTALIPYANACPLQDWTSVS
ncbi:hypothetical protein KDW46_04205 [Burkholderia vietnamiensis]|nr:hypothetical protein [Burkholderia vietnamiensis]